jgi:hypothetical protein
MKRTPKYVRLDVHQATTVASIRDSSGRILAHGIFATEEAAILEFFAGLRGSVHVAFEEGTQAQWLYDLLSPRVHRVVVCDRRGEKRGGNKGDEVDADRLSLDLLRGALRAVYHASRDRTALEEFARTYLNGVEDTTRTMLRLKSLFRARAIPTPGRDVYHPERRGEWLAKLAERGVRFRADSLSRSSTCSRDPPGGQGGDARRGAQGPGLGAAARNPLSRPGACGAAAGLAADPVAIPDQAQPVGVRRLRGGHARQCRVRPPGGPGRASAAPADDAGVESQLQSESQRHLQGRSERRRRTPRPATGLYLGRVERGMRRRNSPG